MSLGEHVSAGLAAGLPRVAESRAATGDRTNVARRTPSGTPA
jgi:hypothetical protein